MSYPKDLAKKVHSTINSTRGTDIPTSCLEDLFELMFFSSLKTEELASITYSIVYIDPNDPDPKPPGRIVADRWSYIELDKQISFNIPNIVKLAKASDPRSSSLAVFHNDQGEIFIWGFIDQMNRRSDFINHESESGPESPGFFQASVESQGHIVVYVGLWVVAELRQNKLVCNSLDIFNDGHIRNNLQPSITTFTDTIRKSVEPTIYQDRDHWKTSHTHLWLSALCRLLIRIKKFNHGGAVLLTPSSENDDLNIKYGTKSERLREALVRKGILEINRTYSSDIIHGQMAEKADSISMRTYLDESVADFELRDTNDEINGCLLYLSHLSRVDGLVLLSKDLTLRGFGVEITTRRDPEHVFKSNSTFADKSSLKEVDFKHFGTRHRSMMRYCNCHEGSIGFVISQDENPKAITKVEDKLIIWEEINLLCETRA
jgi:hypothetical protein